MKKLTLTGKRFGRLFVIAPAENKGVRTQWLCKCDCGKVKKIGTAPLKSGLTLSCGCLRKENNERAVTKHGHNRRGNRSSEYRSWLAARGRCEYPNNIGYKNYGGRGIKFLYPNFENFLDDLGLKPTSQHTLERKNVDGNYEPGNCTWATRAEQSKNTSRTVIVDWEGSSYTLKDLAAHLNIGYTTFLKYFRKKRLPLAEAVEKSRRL